MILDSTQEYRIVKVLYGLPDSNRLFLSTTSKAAQLAESYKMSTFDNCIFY